MCQQVNHSYVGKSECGILKNCEVHAVDSGQNLFFDFLAEGSGKCEFGNGGLVKVDAFGNLILSLHGGDVRCVAGVDQELESSTGKRLVGLSSHDHAKVTMATATACRWDSVGVSKDLLDQFCDRGVGWCANDGSECGMGEAKLDVGVAMFEFRSSNTKAEQWVLWHLFN